VRNHAPCKGIDACRRCALFRDSLECRSGLVDLVVCVGHHGGGGHLFARTGERFVGLVAEDVAEVGDRNGALVGQCSCQGLKAKPTMPVVGLPVSRTETMSVAPSANRRECAARTSVAAPLATSCSSANWRIVSNIDKRVRAEPPRFAPRTCLGCGSGTPGDAVDCPLNTCF
jgi:hypothetical protein